MDASISPPVAFTRSDPAPEMRQTASSPSPKGISRPCRPTLVAQGWFCRQRCTACCSPPRLLIRQSGRQSRERRSATLGYQHAMPRSSPAALRRRSAASQLCNQHVGRVAQLGNQEPLPPCDARQRHASPDRRRSAQRKLLSQEAVPFATESDQKRPITG